MPLFLKSIGFSIVLIGILEGFAEATAGLSKGYFGKLSDTTGKRVPFVQVGYALSAVSKPMMALFSYPVWIFFARTIDRLGKGIRTGARDAMLSEEATPETKGKVFGFHRSMDTLGAVIGPSLALVYLTIFPEDYRTLFFIAIIPGLLAILFTFRLKKTIPETKKPAVRLHFFSFLSYWKESPAVYRQLVAGLLFFTLLNSSDVFLLLQAKQAGLDDAQVIGVYIFYNLMYAVLAFPVGMLADKVGLKTIFIFGLIVFALVYSGMAVNTTVSSFAGLFFLYGLYAASTEGISKAWIATITKKEQVATAIGTFTALQSVFTLLASSLMGLIWFQFGPTTAFILTALLTVVVAIYFLTVPKPVIHTT